MPTSPEPLNPSTTEQLRLKAHLVREGDRIVDAPVVGFAQWGPFTVTSVSPRDCHGLVSLLGENVVAVVQADVSVLVERECSDADDEEPPAAPLPDDEPDRDGIERLMDQRHAREGRP